MMLWRLWRKKVRFKKNPRTKTPGNHTSPFHGCPQPDDKKKHGDKNVPEDNKAAKLRLTGPYYLGDHERWVRLLTAMKVERKEQELIITRIFNPLVTHSVVFRHVQVAPVENTASPIPQLCENTEVTLMIRDNGIADPVHLRAQ
jgi:hypothetical protein